MASPPPAGVPPGDAPREPLAPLFGAPGSPRAWRLFEIFFLPWLHRNLAGIHLAGVEAAARALAESRERGASEAPVAPSASGRRGFLTASTSRAEGEPRGAGSGAPRPLLLVANHTSWFDGFLLREVQRRLRPEAPLRSLMLTRELAKSRTLRWIGGTGFDPERPATLRGALAEFQRLRPSGVTVSWFPQGKMYPATRRPLGFRSGIELALRRLAPVDVLPVALHMEVAASPRPTAWILVGDPLAVETGATGSAAPESMAPVTAALLESRVTELLDRVQHLLHDRGEEALRGWPPPRHGELGGVTGSAVVRTPSATNEAGGEERSIVEMERTVRAEGQRGTRGKKL